MRKRLSVALGLNFAMLFTLGGTLFFAIIEGASTPDVRRSVRFCCSTIGTRR